MELRVGVTRFILAAFFMLVALSIFLTKPDDAFAVGSDGVWVQVPNMLDSHCLGGTILLQTGEVLVTTGYDGSNLTSKSELYNPVSQTWTPTGNVNQARHSWRKAVVRLNNGRVMLVGGADANVTSLASTELYDPNSGTWSYTGSLNVPRRQPAVMKLQNGKVLVAAGAKGPPDGNRFLSSSEIYDPATGQWTYSGDLHVAREVGNSVMLHDGRVMVAGGEGPWFTPGDTAEIYDPDTEQWTLTAPMLYGWFGGASMTVLQDGRVLVAGGVDGKAMIYDPADDTWTYTGSMHNPHGDNAALLSDGNVLVMGGGSVNDKSAEVYDPSTGQWTLIGDMHQEFNTPNGVVTLPNGDIFIAGACAGTAEIFTTSEEPDSDEDGVPDNEDDCPNSDLSPTVVIDGCDSGVTNELFVDNTEFGNGCTISDLITTCAEDASNHGQFVSCVSSLTNDLNNAGIITGQQRGAIQRCAAGANIP